MIPLPLFEISQAANLHEAMTTVRENKALMVQGILDRSHHFNFDECHHIPSEAYDHVMNSFVNEKEAATQVSE